MTCYAPLLCMVDGGQWKHNLIYFNPKTLVRSVNYFVQQMYGCNIGKWMLETKEQLPDGVMVSATADKDAVYVKLVNTTDENMDMDMKISEFMSKEVRVTEYAADPEARNTLTFSGEAEEIAVPKTWTEETGETYCLKVKPRGCYVVVWKKAKA